MFIATAEEYHGVGQTLEEAFKNLQKYYESDKDETSFYEVTPIQVEFKIVKREIPQRVPGVRK